MSAYQLYCILTLKLMEIIPQPQIYFLPTVLLSQDVMTILNFETLHKHFFTSTIWNLITGISKNPSPTNYLLSAAELFL